MSEGKTVSVRRRKTGHVGRPIMSEGKTVECEKKEENVCQEVVTCFLELQ
jgi:hypothetical protein